MGNDWHYSTIHNSPCKIVEEQTLWGEAVCRIWLPNQEAVVRVPRSALRPLAGAVDTDKEGECIGYVAAAAKVAEALERSGESAKGPVLLAPMESNVIPLPHQISVLARATSSDRIRYLLADEVGLGKTIEAGLIMRELKLRGLVRRTLVVAPKGLATQWVAEMDTHFNEPFQVVLGEDLNTLNRIRIREYSGYWASARGLEKLEGENFRNPWRFFDQVIVSLDSVKPMDKRRGWSMERVAAFNRSRFEDLITAGWDLVVVDEAHRLGGSTDQVARYKLGRGLAEAAPYVLLLSATPHQGKTDAFHRLISLLDARAFPTPESVSRERVGPYVIRTEKRKAIDAAGKSLFKPRRTAMAPVRWEDRHRGQEVLYQAVTEYVREGYNRAIREHKRHIGFLMILMQRLVVSSTRAIRTTMERRLEVLGGTNSAGQSGSLRIRGDEEDTSASIGSPSGFSLEDWEDMDGQEQLEWIEFVQAAHAKERSEVETLLEAARSCEQSGPDAKAEALLDWIYRLQSEENDPELKVLVFTEFVPTQEMLNSFLEARGISVATLNGGMDMAQRKRAQDDFRGNARILVSTDAGGEGLNLQFCHVVVNYDIPWNPMRLEQRIGRVDRIGQTKTVRAVNFVFEESVEFRVREVLEQKLSIILEEFGIDKTGDVLDSAQAGELFEEVFASAILDPNGIDSSVEQTVGKIRREIEAVRESSAIYGPSEEPDLQAAENLRSHPLPHWVERMTVGYLESHGGSAIRKRSGWALKWPDGQELSKAVFSSREAERLTDATLLNLENHRVRGLAFHLPMLAGGQPLPSVSIPGLPDSVEGLWGLFEVRLSTLAAKNSELRLPATKRGFFSVFLGCEGKLFLPTARHIWDRLVTADSSGLPGAFAPLRVAGTLGAEESSIVYRRLLEAAERAGNSMFEELRQEHLASISKEEDRGAVFFAARRKAIEHVGLPEVRRFRLERCDIEEKDWQKELNAARQIMPEIRPLLMMKVKECRE